MVRRFLCFVLLIFVSVFFLYAGAVAKAESGYEGMERSVGLGYMVWNCQRINKEFKIKNSQPAEHMAVSKPETTVLPHVLQKFLLWLPSAIGVYVKLILSCPSCSCSEYFITATE